MKDSAYRFTLIDHLASKFSSKVVRRTFRCAEKEIARRAEALRAYAESAGESCGVMGVSFRDDLAAVDRHKVLLENSARWLLLVAVVPFSMAFGMAFHSLVEVAPILFATSSVLAALFFAAACGVGLAALTDGRSPRRFVVFAVRSGRIDVYRRGEIEQFVLNDTLTARNTDDGVSIWFGSQKLLDLPHATTFGTELRALVLDPTVLVAQAIGETRIAEAA